MPGCVFHLGEEGGRVLQDVGTRLTLALLAVLAAVFVFIAVRDKRATDAEEDRRTQDLVCALQADEGRPLDDEC